MRDSRPPEIRGTCTASHSCTRTSLLLALCFDLGIRFSHNATVLSCSLPRPANPVYWRSSSVLFCFQGASPERVFLRPLCHLACHGRTTAPQCPSHVGIGCLPHPCHPCRSLGPGRQPASGPSLNDAATRHPAAAASHTAAVPTTQLMPPAASQEPQGMCHTHTHTRSSPFGAFSSLLMYCGPHMDTHMRQWSQRGYAYGAVVPAWTHVWCRCPHVDTLNLPGPRADMLQFPLEDTLTPGPILGHTEVTSVPAGTQLCLRGGHSHLSMVPARTHSGPLRGGSGIGTLFTKESPRGHTALLKASTPTLGY